MLTTPKLLSIVALSGLAIAIGGSAPARAQTELLINNYLPPNHPFNVGIVEPWIKDVIAATKGSVEPKMSPSAVGPAPKAWETVSAGQSDLVLLANGFQPERILLPTVSHIPFNSPSALKTSVALWRTELEYFHKANEFEGVKLLGSFTGSSNDIDSVNQPLMTLADLKGAKLRTPPGISTTLVGQLGAVPVAAGPGEIFELVSKGMVEGILAPGYALQAFRVMPYIKFVTVVPGGFTNSSYTWLMNRKTWDSLSQEQQAQIMRVSGEVISRNADAIDRMSAAGLDVLQSAGGKILAPSPDLMARLKDLAGAAEGEWLEGAAKKGIDANASLAYYKSQLN